MDQIEEENEDKCSGVATGWHGWTMSRDPGAKGPPERDAKKEKKKMKRRKEKQKKKQTNKQTQKQKQNTKFFKYSDGGPTRHIPMSLSR